MPQITLITNLEYSPNEQVAFRKQLSAKLAQWLNKPEAFCMVVANFGSGVAFAGTDDPAATIEISSLGLPEESLSELTQDICTFMNTSLQIDPARLYVRFFSPPRTHWGWNGKTFG
ncbi:MAG: phenylpyruvate tautomerase MIF-related protein [Verrucomicrobia bacterium]|nr:phenylpyruvate tautomerase MIF-related protein [Verrucomicrobiota bacterium]